MRDISGTDLLAELAILFGYHSFRPYQEQVVRSILEGQDCFAIIPTSGGKSLCYQLSSKILSGACVVVSPLISLMKDQVDAAVQVGLRAAAYNSTCVAAEKANILSRMRQGELDLLYVSPERLRLGDFLNLLLNVSVSFFAIDEAHCISEWGHDFRPDYLALSELRSIFPDVPIAAFTANATQVVARDITERLRLKDPLLVKASFNRPNLFYQVLPKTEIYKQLDAFLSEHPDQPGIIYRTTRANVDITVERLRSKGHDCLAYHAGLGERERSDAQEAFRLDKCRIIVATISFGMGIDKSNVRFVLHGDLPKNVESYYQATGRAGRDGEPATCVIYHGLGDMGKLPALIGNIEDSQVRNTARSQL